ncbi:MAG TPA: GTP cyclohydrolase II [Candidatus Thalassarchaeaceae archaeon]|jgi:GTP cyclohydrolase II|nr:GTP cyclohydrolase II [Candidatus Thalassarchaeaceae archaeon]|tara:strand:+ start:6736 stop:7365 length:630 start_codon:yes stop_codon:yes gene_type:complete
MSAPRILEIGDVPADAKLPTEHGDFRIKVFQDEESGLDHVALLLGDMGGPDPVLVRVHSECLTGDAFGSLRCDCGAQLDSAMRQIQEVGWGCLVYLRQEGRGIGLHAKIQAYNLQDLGADTMEANLMLGHPADARDYGIASDILKSLEIEKVCLMTNNPDKVNQLTELGIDVAERMELIVGVGNNNVEYLTTKVEKMGHQINEDHLNMG